MGVVLPPKKHRLLSPLRDAMASQGVLADIVEVDFKAIPGGAEEDEWGSKDSSGSPRVLLTHCGYLYGEAGGSWWGAGELERLEEIEASGLPVVDSLRCQRIMADRKAVLSGMRESMDQRGGGGQGGVECGER